MTNGYRPDPERLSKAQAEFQRAFAALRVSSDVASLRELLVAVGRLVVQGQDPLGGRKLGRELPMIADVGDFELVAGEIREALEHFDSDDLPFDEAFEKISAALNIRDRLELEMIGAETCGSGPVALDDEHWLQVYTFEESLQPLLWRLTSFNALRSAAIAWIAPEFHERFWWWSDGWEVDPSAAASLSSVAQLIARFEGAQETLRALVQTESLWLARAFSGVSNRSATEMTGDLERTADLIEALAPSETETEDIGASVQQSGDILSLGRWIQGRRSAQDLNLAAATDEELVLIEDPAFTASWLAPATLFLDMLEPLSDSLRVEVTFEEELMTFSPVEGAVGRFECTLPPHAADHVLEILIPFVDGLRIIRLPPDVL